MFSTITKTNINLSQYLSPVKVLVKEKPLYQAITVQHRTYDFQENAERLYNRATQALSHQQTIPEMAYSEKHVVAGRNIFLIHGAHYNPLHIRNMAKVFDEEKIIGNKNQWLFLIEGITTNAADYSPYAEIEYAAQSAQAWNIPVENIIPFYNNARVFEGLAQKVGAEKAIFYLVMFAMHTGDIRFIEGVGYSPEQINNAIESYVTHCQKKNIPFNRSVFGALFPINNENWDKSADECWDLHQGIRNDIAAENLEKVFVRYPNAKNILVYCGRDHAKVFRPK